MTQPPVVAIVGRPNVGKSAIFNRLAGRQIAIVHDQPGVTRDRITAECRNGAHPFTIIDTGGIGSSLDDDFSNHVEAEADIAIAAADLILFIVDGKDGITPIDESVATILRRSGTPVVLVINKADHQGIDPIEADFAGLGFRESIAVSAAHGRRFPELTRAIESRLEASGLFSVEATDPGNESSSLARIAIVGRPNVGKSSLVNAILNDKRTIVSPVPGTTRDAVDIPYQLGKRAYTLIDTAGILPRAKRTSSVEVFSMMRSEKSIRRADLCLLVLDASTGVTAQDRKIARLILKSNKPCILVLNKFDLYHPDGAYSDRIALLREHVERELFFLHYALFTVVSARDGTYLDRIFKAIEKLRRESRKIPNTGVLNRTLRKAVEKAPPPLHKGKRLNLLYATHAKSPREAQIPVPIYILFVNRAQLLSKSYERYLENELRRSHDCEGLPIIFQVRSRRDGDRKSG